MKRYPFLEVLIINADKRKFANSILNKGVVIMALIVSRAILFLILALAFGIATVFT